MTAPVRKSPEKSDLLLPRPEHHIRLPGKTHTTEEKVARNLFSFLEFDIIIGNDMGQQSFSFIDRKESSGTCVSPHSKGQLFVRCGYRFVSVLFSYPLRSHGASQTEIRQTRLGL